MRRIFAPSAVLALLATLAGCQLSSAQLLAQLPGGGEAAVSTGAPAGGPLTPTIPGARPAGGPATATGGATTPVGGPAPAGGATPAPGASPAAGASPTPAPLNPYNPLFVEGRTWAYRLTEQRGGGMAATSDFTVRVKAIAGTTVTVVATQTYLSSAGGGPLPPAGPDQPSTFPLDARNPFIKWGGGTGTPPVSAVQEDVSVPAGDFRAIKETYEGAGPAPQVDELWMAPGVGMVKRRIATKGSTTAPLSVFELKARPR